MKKTKKNTIKICYTNYKKPNALKLGGEIQIISCALNKCPNHVVVIATTIKH
jgi:hypothetical protein